jgi:hypothetical protein
MSVQYTVREISTSSITVDYADGSWAIVPIHSAMSKQDIENTIGNFQPSANQFNSVEDVPFNVGDSGTTKSFAQKELERKQIEEQQNEESKNRLLTYRDLRSQNYPPLGDQLDALYWARQGDDTVLQQIDNDIESVKAQFPKDMPAITQAEYDAIIEGAANDVLG